MDCVTCILVGMCVMCGPGIGSLDRGASASGRPMTEAEVDEALSGLLQHFRPTTRRPSVTYSRRQSFIPDYRFSDIGIGKRLSEETTLPKPSLHNGIKPSVPKVSDKQVAELLYWPAIHRQLLDFKKEVLKENTSGDSIKNIKQEEEGFNKRLKTLSSGSEARSVNDIVSKLKRVKLEEELLKKIAKGNRIATELGRMRTRNGDAFDANEMN